MQFPATPGLATLSRPAWQALLSRYVREAEFEPRLRRRRRRYKVQFGAWRLLYHQDGKPIAVRVRLMNAALDGLMVIVMSREAVPGDIPVLLALTTDDAEEAVLAGEIVHCTSTVGGYKVGIRLRFPATRQEVS